MPGLISPSIRSSLPPLPFIFPSRFPLKREVAFAPQMVLEACRMAEEIRSHPPMWCERKWDGSQVSVADFAIQYVCTRKLAVSFPGDVILSEEDGRTLEQQFPPKARKAVVDVIRRHDKRFHPKHLEAWIEKGRSPLPSSRYWTSDPIDVTAEFIKGGQYSVNLALSEDGGIKIGVIGCPNMKLPHSPPSNRGELLVAVQGYGAWSCGLTEDDQFHRLHVSDRHSLSQALWALPLRDKSPRFTDQDYHLVRGCLEVFGKVVGGVRRAVSPVRYAWVAAGLADFFINFRLDCINSPFYVHDHAAGVLLVQEAGGTVTTLRRRPLDFRTPPWMGELFGLLVSNSPLENPSLHDEVLSRFRRVAWDVFPVEKRRELYK